VAIDELGEERRKQPGKVGPRLLPWRPLRPGLSYGLARIARRTQQDILLAAI